jgi:hypothetical protein
MTDMDLCKDDGAHNSEENIKHMLIQILKRHINDSLMKSIHNVSFLAKVSLKNEIQLMLGETFPIVHEMDQGLSPDETASSMSCKLLNH